MSRRSDMSRAPDDVVQTALRMRESDHAWLVQAAKKNRQTLNNEILWRLGASRNQSLGVELAVAIEAIIPRLEPYLTAANERDVYGEVTLAAREMADVLAPLLAAGAIKGETAKRAGGAINRLNLARYNLECILGENRILTPGQSSWQALARASTEARFKDPEGKRLNAKEREARELWMKEGKTLEEAAALAVREPEIEELGVKEPEAKRLGAGEGRYEDSPQFKEAVRRKEARLKKARSEEAGSEEKSAKEPVK